MTIDRTARNYAADLIRWFRDCRISNDEFYDQWPIRSEDAGLTAIWRELWFTYSDLKNHTLSGKYSLDAEDAAIYERCILFLQSDKEYVWPELKGFLPGGIGWLFLILSLGVLLPLHRWIKRRNKAALDHFRAAGDYEVWPFISKADYERAFRKSFPPLDQDDVLAR
ncbi:MAG: hypothetical protein Q7T44_00500 [Parvibaculum sp.]|nr:hypothetical protein [Parvibaculum sp.]